MKVIEGRGAREMGVQEGVGLQYSRGSSSVSAVAAWAAEGTLAPNSKNLPHISPASLMPFTSYTRYFAVCQCELLGAAGKGEGMAGARKGKEGRICARHNTSCIAGQQPPQCGVSRNETL
jgi:hypothetical protein